VFETWEEFALSVDGSNLVEVLGHPLVDKTRTVCNNVNEVYTTLGVEAARSALMFEIKTTLTGLYVQERHLELLLDVITCKGAIMAISRHGINRGDTGPLAKCSFEESHKMLINAGIFAEVDKMNGVSANVMLGQIPMCGTGDTKLILDIGKLNKRYTAGKDIQNTSASSCDMTFEMLGYDFMPKGDEVYL
jgi:DNA-directed RNA polymerase II subunit RPB1